MKKVFILLGNPDKDSYSGAMADTYEASAREAGHDVRRVNLGDISFDPILHKGYKTIQALEPDLITVQEHIKWCDHFVLVYPNWWNTMPALLKGFFDRAWLPGFAFNFEKPSHKLIQRMEGKTARVIVIAGTQSPFMTWWKYGDYTNEVERGILGFSGFNVKVSAYGPCEHCADVQKTSWIDQVKELGRKAM